MKNILRLAAIIGSVILLYNLYLHPALGVVSQPAQREASQAEAPKMVADRLLLMPLDGRPPCKQFVIDLGKIGGYEVAVPPSELQDYYSQPGDTAQLRQWLRENIKQAGAAIISTDQLLYGGLLAAREFNRSPQEIAEFISYLKQLHQENPQVPLWAFSILPRQLPPDSIDGLYEKKYLMEYSRLTGRRAAGQEIDEARLAWLQDKIPEEIMNKYLSRFRENELLNQELIKLVQDGTLSLLVLGQDDGEKFSIPNLEKQRLQQLIASQGLDNDKVFLTHGADEIAQLLLARWKNQNLGAAPRVYLQYNDDSTPQEVMPYMAVSVEATAREKLRLAGCCETMQQENADFTLFLSCNSEATLATRAKAAGQIKDMLLSDQPVALVDLCRHFQGQEAVLPFLIKNDAPLQKLCAYAGWNTTSNAIGTAVSQATLLHASLAGMTTAADGHKDKPAARNSSDTCAEQSTCADNTNARLLQIYQHQLAFLNNRFLEDYYYLKESIDLVNNQLIKDGYIDTADLDLEHNHQYAVAMLQGAMQQRVEFFTAQTAFRQPVTIKGPNGSLRLAVTGLRPEMYFPWPRTFEIFLESHPVVQQLP